MLFNTFHLLEEINEFHFGESWGKKSFLLFRTHIQCAGDVCGCAANNRTKIWSRKRTWVNSRIANNRQRRRRWVERDAIPSKNLVFTLHISIFTCSKRIQTGKWMENNIFMNMTISLLIMWPGMCMVCACYSYIKPNPYTLRVYFFLIPSCVCAWALFEVAVIVVWSFCALAYYMLRVHCIRCCFTFVSHIIYARSLTLRYTYEWIVREIFRNSHKLFVESIQTRI